MWWSQFSITDTNHNQFCGEVKKFGIQSIMADNGDKNEAFAAADAERSTTSNNHNNMNGH